MMPLVSIIVPVYNSYSFLAKCLESVLSQTYDRWECLLVDDGSTDGSGGICDTWAKKDHRFKVFHQDNQGVSAARNRGIKEASGDFIAFIDSDDWVDVDYLSDMFDSVDVSTELIVTGLFYEDGDRSRFLAPNDGIELRLLQSNSSIWIKYINLLNGPCAKLYRSSIISRHRIHFLESLSLGEDLLFNLDYLNQIEKIKFIPKANYHYRIHHKISLSTVIREDKFDIEYFLWKSKLKFFSQKGLWCNPLSEYMNRELWGIVYDGIFRIDKPSINYLHHVLSIPELDTIEDSKAIFPASNLIKKSIIRRDYLFFYLLRRI